jgi:aspartyl-tRNA(Asn)/glutamyl-tRNA(Gln) amidotransferase subunit B
MQFVALCANYLTADIFGLLKKDGKELIEENLPLFSALQTLIEMIMNNELSSRGAKDMLPLMLADQTTDVKKVAEEKGFIQKNDPELLKKIVEEVIAENQTQVADYKSGKESMFMFFVGQCMKKSKGAGNPGVFQELLRIALSA